MRIYEANEVNAIDEYKMQFFLDLMNPKLDKTWEVINFRELFFERLTTDEMYFFL